MDIDVGMEILLFGSRKKYEPGSIMSQLNALPKGQT